MRKKRRELILFCSLLLATTPAYAENATEAVSISDTASDIGWTVDAIEEVQSVSESDTPKTLASNEEIGKHIEFTSESEVLAVGWDKLEISPSMFRLATSMRYADGCSPSTACNPIAVFQFSALSF